jgi:hypothetical protein
MRTPRIKQIMDEPSCRASLKNSGIKRMIGMKRKNMMKPCNDFLRTPIKKRDGAS